MDTNQNQNSKGIIITIIVILALIVGGTLVWSRMNNSSTPTQVESNQTPIQTATTTDQANATTTQTKSYTITLTDSGYSPTSLTIDAGETVTFVNNSSGKMWTASASHPTHTDYPAFDEKSAADHGQSWSFTFTKAGTWKYHNHLNPSQFGTVKVNIPAK